MIKVVEIPFFWLFIIGHVNPVIHRGSKVFWGVGGRENLQDNISFMNIRTSVEVRVQCTPLRRPSSSCSNCILVHHDSIYTLLFFSRESLYNIFPEWCIQCDGWWLSFIKFNALEITQQPFWIPKHLRAIVTINIAGEGSEGRLTLWRISWWLVIATSCSNMKEELWARCNKMIAILFGDNPCGNVVISHFLIQERSYINT